MILYHRVSAAELIIAVKHIRVRAYAFYMHASLLALFPETCMHAYALTQWPCTRRTAALGVVEVAS